MTTSAQLGTRGRQLPGQSCGACGGQPHTVRRLVTVLDTFARVNRFNATARASYRHAIIETVFAEVIDRPLARIPSSRFGANSAWVLCAAPTHNL